MLKFIGKVWIAGEVNDFRKARKERKRQEKLAGKERQRLRMANICKVEEALRQPKNRRLRKEYEKYENMRGLSLIIAIMSGVFMAFIPPLLLISIGAIINMTRCIIKVENISYKMLKGMTK